MTKLLRSIICLFFLLGGSVAGLCQFKVVGYQPYWSGSASSIQYSKLTHINYSFALPQSDGHLKALSNPGFLQQIVSNAHAAGTKVFIAIGGWSDNGTVIDPTFETLAASSAGRTNLVNDAMNLVSSYNLDGVDIDWEFPDGGSSSSNFTALMQQLSNALKAKGKGLSCAVSASSYYGNNIAAAVFGYIDHLNVMAYDNDQEANHSSYSYAQASINLYANRGCPKNKIILGVPFYARPSWTAYKDLLAKGASPNSDQYGSDYYNGIPTIQSKTQLAYNSAGGIMIWELSQDATGANSLLSAIYTKIQSLGGGGGGGNKNPTISLTAPGNGASYTAPASVTISANASDSDGSISKVEFYNGSTLLNSDNSSPYSYSWNNVAAGTYSITAKAYDNSGATATTGAVSITVKTATTGNKAPTVSITSPGNGASFNAPASVTINASASDADGSIAKVEFYNGSTLLSSDNSSPYSYSWTNVGAGTYSITARAYDNAGASTTSGAVSITVNSSTGGGGCTGVAQYVENGGYNPGSKVKNAGGVYQCKPWPYSGWCNGAAWAYGPGTGTYWQDAWTFVSSCTPKSGTVSSSISSNEGVSPNPAINTSYVNLNLSAVSSGEETLSVISSTGEVISSNIIMVKEGDNQIPVSVDNLKNGIYLIKIGEKNFRFVKGQ